MANRFAAFRHSSYSRYFLSRFLTSFSSQIVSVSVAWQMYDETRNPALLGWIGLVQFLPALLLVVVTGNAADRLGRRLVMGCGALVMMSCAASILWLVLNRQFDPMLVLAILTLFGTARAFYGPAATSLAVNLVPREDFANAVSWVTSSWQLASIAGPVVGSLLYGLAPQAAYGTATCLFILAASLIFSIPKPAQKIFREPPTLASILGGFGYIWKDKVVLGAVSLDLFAVLLGGAVALMPVYARDILHVGELGLGLLRAAPGVGAIIAIALITAFPIRDHAGWILIVSVALFGLATAVFGGSTLAWLSILALMCVGGFDMISVYVREIILQLWTPDEVRGRVNAVNSIFVGASNELGETRAGFMAAVIGPVATVVLGGVAAVGVAAASAFIFPRLRDIRRLDEREDEATRIT
ncbi:MFS transporter [Hyphomonas sp.]|uniref:MFS transporter n=1 Tax=Hyphomonas sp. TaxID=87 RepID=UPI001DB0A587|nr:MFS transporter [Hyphomonas sp.]MBU3919319.1 MFS transporter [Alphaproteobacteria bacterium]MBU4060370.1 MFS transporter [Alphaproteobacteria bacterium]MBU4163038.1 MFS transporter [Alphaproteobacteria bacterium]